jgi:hypothetical protein
MAGTARRAVPVFVWDRPLAVRLLIEALKPLMGARGTASDIALRVSRHDIEFKVTRPRLFGRLLVTKNATDRTSRKIPDI